MGRQHLKLVETTATPRAALDVIQRAFERSLRGCAPDYRRRHMTAWTSTPGSPSASFAVTSMLHALAEYADAYRRRWPGMQLGSDGVLGDAWEQMLRGFLGLLNGELGNLDGGALDAAARDLHQWAGFDEEL